MIEVEIVEVPQAQLVKEPPEILATEHSAHVCTQYLSSGEHNNLSLTPVCVWACGMPLCCWTQASSTKEGHDLRASASAASRQLSQSWKLGTSNTYAN
eukprot:1743522-Amphidinium_carterae.1